MDWKLIFVFAALVIYIVYNVASLILFGVPKSLSDTYYLFEEKKGWMRCFFPIMMFSIVVYLMPSWIEISEGSNFQFLSFLAAGSFMFTGSAPAFKNSSIENKVHMTSAKLAALFAILWVIYVSKMWFFIVLWAIFAIFCSVFTDTYKKALIYWLETIAFLATFSSIIAYYLV